MSVSDPLTAATRRPVVRPRRQSLRPARRSAPSTTSSTAISSRSRWARNTRPPTACSAMVATLDGETDRQTANPSSVTSTATTRRSPKTPAYLSSMPYTDRLDYLCSMTTNWAYALAVEKLSGQAVPDRAQYLRVIMAELTRLIVTTSASSASSSTTSAPRSPRCSTPSANAKRSSISSSPSAARA